jgi:hypothetical protein
VLPASLDSPSTPSSSAFIVVCCRTLLLACTLLHLRRIVGCIQSLLSCLVVTMFLQNNLLSQRFYLQSFDASTIFTDAKGHVMLCISSLQCLALPASPVASILERGSSPKNAEVGVEASLYFVTKFGRWHVCSCVLSCPKSYRYIDCYSVSSCSIRRLLSYTRWLGSCG